MSKAVHPITNLAERLVKRWPDYAVHQLPFAEKEIARHVKPLLDALEKQHNWLHGSGNVCAATNCEVKGLLAAWKEKP